MQLSLPKKINTADIDWKRTEHGDFSCYRKSLAIPAGGEKIGTSLYKLEPGKKAFPFHCHHANEEAIFIIEGQGSLRVGDETITVVEQDYIALPCGIKYAHQIINTSDAPLVYLCISTMNTPDVMEYPDSGKIGVMTGTAPGGRKNTSSDKRFYIKNDDISYFTNET